MSGNAQSARRPPMDGELQKIAAYVGDYEVRSEEALETARLCLMDSLGCGFLALGFPECARLLGPIVPGTVVPGGAKVPGTAHVLDPVKAAWDIGCMIRWLDFNDTWLAAEWGHPSDNLGAILATADYVSRRRLARGEAALTVRDVLDSMIKAHEIQGVIALENAFNRVGLDHVLLVRVASAAIAAGLLGGSRAQIADALSHAWIDGSALRTYRHAPNTGPRKSWAAGDATSRGVRLAGLVMQGEMGYPSALTAPDWGFCDVAFGGNRLRIDRDYGSYVMENILFKISYPAEFHAQTAVEAAIRLHASLAGRLADIERVQIHTQESAMRIINKEGELNNPADRDHCLQYMVAIALLRGGLSARDYSDEAAADPQIDRLRSLMHVAEDRSFSADYLDPQKRSIGNRVQVFFTDGTSSDPVEIHYPVGHRRRRAEGVPLLIEKFRSNVGTRFDEARARSIFALFEDPRRLAAMPVTEFIDALTLTEPA